MLLSEVAKAALWLPMPPMVRDFGHRAESIGLDSIWMGEHVVLFDKNTFG